MMKIHRINELFFFEFIFSILSLYGDLTFRKRLLSFIIICY